jgi:benzoyl-CoA reductase/2-hydroxyglutaryl-CoA dehydratase subunit BcrC/BadD/HgdB
MAGVPTELLAAVDICWDWPENFGTLCASKLVTTRFIEVAEAEGYHNDLCSYVNNTMGYPEQLDVNLAGVGWKLYRDDVD